MTTHMLLSWHGRDNKLHDGSDPNHPWTCEQTFISPQLPNLKFSMDVNALNFCRFSHFKGGPGDRECPLLGVPHLVDSAFVGLYFPLLSCPSETSLQQRRIFRSLVINELGFHLLTRKEKRT